MALDGQPKEILEVHGYREGWRSILWTLQRDMLELLNYILVWLFELELSSIR